MLAFLDESGDPGVLLDRGSSAFFVLAMVAFDDHTEAAQCDARIHRLRDELRLAPDFEFHFSHNSLRQRRRFLEAVSPFDFNYHAFALDKARLLATSHPSTDAVYSEAIRMLFRQARGELRDAIVLCDRAGDRNFRNQLAAFVRSSLKTRASPVRGIRRFKLQRSSGNNLLQLADYVAAVSARAFAGKQDGIEWRARYLRAREASWQCWP